MGRLGTFACIVIGMLIGHFLWWLATGDAAPKLEKAAFAFGAASALIILPKETK